MKLGSLLGLLCLSATVSIAEELPRVDAASNCKRKHLAQSGLNLETRYAKCVDDEQAAYDWLKPRWPNFSDNWQRDCIAKASGVDFYPVLKKCAEEKIAIKEAYERERRLKEESVPKLPHKEFRY